MRIYLIFLYFVFSSTSLYAQFKPRYSQYILNPFIYNPAFAGKEGRYELHLNHKRQWIGIQDAPVVSTVSFHTGFSSGLSLGLNAYNYTRGVVSTNSAQLAAGYQVHIGLQHSLHFGLSGAFSHTGLDYSRIANPNDPAILAGDYNTFVQDGQFGINYHMKGLNLGFTLPSLLNNNSFGPGSAHASSDTKKVIDPFNSYIINADYQFNFGQSALALHPYLLYHVDPSVSAQWEAGGLLHFYNKFHVGSAYRQNYGITAMTGFRIDKTIALGYAYEFANQIVNKMGQGSHEIQLSIYFGKVKSKHTLTDQTKKSPVEEKAVEKDTPEQILPKPEPQPQLAEQTPTETEKETEEEEHQEPARSSYKRGNHADELPAGYFVVVGVYSNKANAQRAIQQLAEKGYPTSKGYSSQTNYYYVYIGQTPDIKACRNIRNEYRQLALFQDAWMLEIKE